MEPLNQNEEIVTLEMFRTAIIKLSLEIHQNSNTHMETGNQASFNENQVDGQHGLPFSIEMQSDYSQCESVNFQLSTEPNQENISLEKHQIKSNDAASFQISTEEDLCDKNQTYPLDLDILRFGCEEQTTNSELQSQNVVYDIKQPSGSNVINSNINNVNLSNPTADNSNTCEICNGKFISRSDLGRHMLIHTGEKQFPCNVCNVKFNRKCNLQQHMKIIHYQKKKLSICSVCGLGFSEKASLQSHKLIHTSCSVCNKQFKSNSHLQRHKIIHTGGKPFRCSYCGTGFSQKDYLQKHMLNHTGEKP